MHLHLNMHLRHIDCIGYSCASIYTDSINYGGTNSGRYIYPCVSKQAEAMHSLTPSLLGLLPALSFSRYLR